MADYSYDALDRRINKKAYDNYGTLTKDINTLYDGWQEVQELSGTTPTANLLTGPGLDEIFRRTTTAANTQNPSVTNDYLTDALHSTMALTDATGAIQTTYTYQPYGGTGVYGTATDNPYQFTGRENDQNGLMYFRNRYLTTVGQFASEDPMGFGAGQNMFAYVKGNPVMFVDPMGLLNGCIGPFCSPDVGGPPGTLTPDWQHADPNNPDSPAGPGIHYQWPESPPSNPLDGPPLQLPSCFPNCPPQDNGDNSDQSGHLPGGPWNPPQQPPVLPPCYYTNSCLPPPKNPCP